MCHYEKTGRDWCYSDHVIFAVQIAPIMSPVISFIGHTTHPLFETFAPLVCTAEKPYLNQTWIKKTLLHTADRSEYRDCLYIPVFLSRFQHQTTITNTTTTMACSTNCNCSKPCTNCACDTKSCSCGPCKCETCKCTKACECEKNPDCKCDTCKCESACKC